MPPCNIARESWRFGLWLEERIAARRLPAGPVEDAIRLEMAMFDVQAAQRDGNAEAGGGSCCCATSPTSS